MGNSIRYSELFSINLLHDYFDDGLCTALSLEPAPQCARLMSQNACKFRVSANGGQLYYGTRGEQQAALDINDAEPFTFLIRNSDPEFEIFTTPDWGDGDLQGGCLYMNNLNARQQQGGAGEERLIAASDATVLPVRNHMFRQDFDPPVDAAMLTLHRHHDGTEVWAKTSAAEPSESVSIDLQDLSDGRYVLKLNGVDELDFYLTETPAANFFGVIEIFAHGSSWGAAAARPDTVDFAFSFTTRKTHWRYVIVYRDSAREMSGASITSEPPGVKFNAPVLTQLDGNPACVITSVNSIPLYLSPANHYKFELHLPQNGANLSDPVRLPYATPATARWAIEGDTTKIWSTIYVYL
jgi:hypothetical protein